MTGNYDVDVLLDFREMKDDFFKYRPESPLTDAQKQAFTGLSYYPPNPAFALQAEVTVLPEQKQILMHTNRDELKPFYRYGTFDLQVGTATATLTVYKSPDGYYFLPFVDAAAGESTYSAGRYLDLQAEREGDGTTTFHIDFNHAYNPYCAYNNRFVCPITPAENHLNLHIDAGEMLPRGGWVQT